MNIGQNRFPILTPEQANPGISQLSKLLSMHLQNMQGKAMLENQNLTNQRAQALLPFMGQEEQQKLSLGQQNLLGKQLQNKIAQLLMPYQVPEEQAKIGLEQAQANQARNPNNFQGGQIGYLNNQLLEEIKRINPDLNDSQVQDAKGAYLEGQTTLPDGTKLAPANGNINSYADMLNIHRNTAQGNNQINSGAAIDTTLSNADKVAKQAFSYAGAKGKAQLLKDQSLASAGLPTSPSYQAFLDMVNVYIPTMATQIIKTEGGNSTDGQKALAIKQADPISLLSNPDLAFGQYNALKKMLSDINKTNAQSFTQKRAQASQGSNDYGSSNNNDYSISVNNVNPKIQMLMNTYGLSQNEAQAITDRSS